MMLRGAQSWTERTGRTWVCSGSKGETAGVPPKKSLPAVQPESDQGRDSTQSINGNFSSSSQTQHEGTTSAEQSTDNSLEPASSSHPLRNGFTSLPPRSKMLCLSLSQVHTSGGISCSPCLSEHQGKGRGETIPVMRRGRLGQRVRGRLGKWRRGLPVQGLVQICPGSRLGCSSRVWGYTGEGPAPE